MAPKTDRSAFTLIEVLVVICILGVLAALLLPVLNSAREAARRDVCLSNLAQLAMALHNYETSFEALPPGVVNDTGPIKNVPVGYHVGWMVMVLPYADRSNVYRRFDLTAGVYSPANSTCRRVSVGLFVCPSTPTSLLRGADGTAASCYAGNHHNAEAPIDVTNNGVLYLNSRTRYEDIPDGTSMTLLIGEKAPFMGDLGWASGTRSTLRNAGLATMGTAVAPRGVTTMGMVINDPESSEDLEQSASDPVGGFESFHPGVVNVVFCDGSVHTMSRLVSAQVFRALASRAGGELLSNANQF